MNLTKISILTLYLRVFPNKWFQLFVRWFLAALIVFAIASVGATILQCQPIARNWNHDLPGRCFALVTFWYFNAAISIFSDLVILLAPMPLILVLQLPRSQKVGLVVIFGLGVLFVYSPLCIIVFYLFDADLNSTVCALLRSFE